MYCCGLYCFVYVVIVVVCVCVCLCCCEWGGGERLAVGQWWVVVSWRCVVCSESNA